MLIADWMTRSGVAFGTSGARGLVTAMTDAVCFAYTLGYLKHLSDLGAYHPGDDVALAGDLRPSTPRILRACAAAVRYAGGIPLSCGTVPTPALCNYAYARGIPSLMVTGSHIPADRNGIKFNRPRGEFLKEDEAGMRQHSVILPEGWFNAEGALIRDFPQAETVDVLPDYIARYRNFFGATALNGMSLGVYQHSAVGRDILVTILEALGAQVTALGRSDVFMPVDTEAVREEDIALARDWAATGGFDAILTTDGDSDRPLLADKRGQWLRGDVLGIVAARFLRAQAVTTPINSNTALEKTAFASVIRRTRIGSPFVVAGMTEAANAGHSPSVGYEANGGFLLATSAEREGHVLDALPTRDAVLPMLCALVASQDYSGDLIALLDALPARFTLSDRLAPLPTTRSTENIAILKEDLSRRGVFEPFTALCGPVTRYDETDGLRVVFERGDIVHLRPSGNAPELRVYVEAETPERAAQLLTIGVEYVRPWQG
ncbi:phosphomannomutase [Asaia krungthepensis]|uniref:Phosphoglucosamine mutase n=1 Tax=Asaia krungthepensis NRIC 0535 TaxID=1307925 RepID=A0ABQ0Q1C0_9PROT|nr:phosphomannomutase [Asaia krungthepensis]GBQ86666.1 phosphoglucosamine mutase [Asaia krungthepensis NRIC 0535]